MQVVIADAGPVNYLILIQRVEILGILFEQVILPVVVQEELRHEKSPQAVRAWMASPPGWLDVRQGVSDEKDASLANIDRGERAAIQLACELKADLVLMDDRKGVAIAQSKGLPVTGTPGVLDLAAERGSVDFGEAIRELERTNFRRPIRLIQLLLAKHSGQSY